MSEGPESAKIYAFPGGGSRENLHNKQYIELDPKRLSSLEAYLEQFPPTSEEDLARTHRVIGQLPKEYLVGVINTFSPENASDMKARVAVYRAFLEQLMKPEKVARLFESRQP